MRVFKLPAGAVGLLERSADWRGSEIVLIDIGGSSKFVRLNILAICRRREAEICPKEGMFAINSWALAVPPFKMPNCRMPAEASPTSPNL